MITKTTGSVAATERMAGEFAATLRGGEWTQLTTVLARSGVRNGYARVRAATTPPPQFRRPEPRSSAR